MTANEKLSDRLDALRAHHARAEAGGGAACGTFARWQKFRGAKLLSGCRRQRGKGNPR